MQADPAGKFSISKEKLMLMKTIQRPSRSGRFSILAVVLLSFALLTLSGCAGLDMNRMLAAVGLADTNSIDTPDGMVMRGMDAFNEGEYASALKIFEDLRDSYPFSKYSLLADLKSADCHYYLHEYAEARDLYEEFEGNHPTNEAMPYVLFQIGMCSYKQIGTIDRDTSDAVRSMQALTRLLRVYPASPYTSEAKARITACRNFMARHEMYVAVFYVRTEEFTQAEGRLKFLLTTYPESKECPKAKELLAAIESGNPPHRSWRDWIPDITLPDWRTFAGGLSMQGSAGSKASDGP